MRNRDYAFVNVTHRWGGRRHSAYRQKPARKRTRKGVLVEAKPTPVSSPASQKKWFNVARETDPEVVELAERTGSVLLAMIGAPLDDPAVIWTEEEFGFETMLAEIRRAARKARLRHGMLLLNTSGGIYAPSYKIAMAVRETFEELTCFVPHEAASCGTLIALSADEIVMGMMSHLSPIDVQMVTKEGHGHEERQIPARAVFRDITSLAEDFTAPGKRNESTRELWQKLSEKLDPTWMATMKGESETVEQYAMSLLRAARYETREARQIAQKLIYGFPSHSYVLMRDEARDIGLRIKPESSHPREWPVMRRWFEMYMLKSSDTHFIRYVIPERIRR